MKTAPYFKAICLLSVMFIIFSATSCKSNNATSQNDPANKSSVESNVDKTSTSQSTIKANQNNSETTLSTVKTIQGVTTTEVEPPSGNPQTDKFTLTTSAKVDLNGDGVKDSIDLSHVKSHRPTPQQQTMFDLQINDASIQGSFDSEELFDGFAIVDIDKSDKYKEIAVHTPGPSDDDEYLIYWYDGSSIKEVGHLSRWPRFTGNGIVYVNGWVSFWQDTDKYVLTKQRTLQLVPQPFHYVGMKCKVKTSFPIYESINSRSIVANLRSGSQIFVVLGDISNTENSRTFYLVRSESNLLGWVEESNLISNTDLQVAD
jgi:hypothetical protein